MIKQIQLRGISRAPSDRMTADGGCDESINVQYDGVETAPVIAPEDVSEDYGVDNFPGPVLFIHKGVGYTNAIFHDLSSGKIKARAWGWASSDESMTVYSLAPGETINTITSVGNTLIISTNQRIEYVLYKGGVYIILGDRIPVPTIQFKTEFVYPEDEAALFPEEDGRITENKVGTSSLKSFDESLWAAYLRNAITQAEFDRAYQSAVDIINETFAGGGISQTARELLLEDLARKRSQPDAEYSAINQTIWGYANLLLREIKSRKYYATPVMVRYAVKLYDGSYIYQSVPILLGGGIDNFLVAWGERESSGSTFHSRVHVKLRQAYKVVAELESDYTEFEGWEDIVESIDIFTSTDIHWPLANAPVTGVAQRSGSPLLYDLSFNYMEGGVIDPDVNADKQKEEVLSKSEFYLMKTIPVKKLSSFASTGYRLLSDDKFASEDFLVTQKRLPDDYQSHHRKFAERFFQYNKRLFLINPTSELSGGYACLNACDGDKNGMIDARLAGGKVTLEFKYFLSDNDGNEYVVKGMASDGGYSFAPYQNSYQSGGQTYTYWAIPRGWLVYPDARCKKVEVKCTVTGCLDAGVTLMSYEMTSHPALNCSYAFLGLGRWVIMGITPGTPIQSSTAVENSLMREPNVFWASEMNNPFQFPRSGRMTFSSKVLTLAAGTRPLSSGPVGPFPITVFTKDGIWQVQLNKTGDFGECVSASRDVISSPDSVIGIEQAVIFVTRQGVKMMTDIINGGDVVPLSDNMAGGHYRCPQALAELIATDSELSSFADFSDLTTFNEYIDTCKIAYDYTNSRVIFYRDYFKYYYVYMLKSRSWHKLSLYCGGVSDIKYMFDRALNSYPECMFSGKYQVAGGAGQPAVTVYALLDCSVPFDGTASQKTLPGVIITRPLDLDAPDVRKSINILRIRGKLHKSILKTSARYILLGSMDGFNWQRLVSLRGGSYKYFRLVLILKMGTTERLSWVDIDCDMRFTHKLR